MGDLFHAKRELNYTKKLCDFIIKIKRRKIKYNQILQTIKKLLVQQINKILLFFIFYQFLVLNYLTSANLALLCLYLFVFLFSIFLILHSIIFFFTFFFKKLYILKCIFKYISMLIL